MSEMDYLTNYPQKNDQTEHVETVKQKVVCFLMGIPEPAAHSVALQLVKMDRSHGKTGRLDRSLAVCLGMICLAVVEELI
jgi:hypothetical protein